MKKIILALAFGLLGVTSALAQINCAQLPTIACEGGGGGVSSVTNSDGSLTISPTTGAAVASLNVGHANTWTAVQTFSPASPNPSSGIGSFGVVSSGSFGGGLGLLDGSNAWGLYDTSGTLNFGESASGAGGSLSIIASLSASSLLKVPGSGGFSIGNPGDTATTGDASAITEIINPTGTVSSPFIYPLNNICIGCGTADNMNAGGGFIDGFQIIHDYGGSSAYGGRQSLVVQGYLTAPTNSANTNRNYVAFQALEQASTGDGGTTGTNKGAVFASNFIAQALSGATNLLELSGSEVNILAPSGSSMSYKNGWSIVEASGDAVQGSNYDAALAISNESGAEGWRTGVLFGPMNGQGPMSATGTLIATSGSATVTNGIDFSSYTFTGSSINVPGFNVAPSGKISAGNSSLSGVALYLQNTAGACTLTPTATTAVFSCSSDERLKTDLGSPGDQLTFLDTFHVHKYRIKSTGEVTEGAFAQEVALNHPDMVHKGTDGYLRLDGVNPWSIIGGVQELDAYRTSDEDRITQLEREITVLLRKNK